MSQDQILKINKRSFLIVLAVLFTTMIGAYILTFVWGNGYSFFKFIISPVLVLTSSDSVSIIVIGLFILILGGAFNIIDKTGGIKAIISSIVSRFKTRKMMLMSIITLFFMLFGALFGIFEESVTLLPMIIMLSLSLGWDTYTGLGMCLLAAGFGFSSALINPFSIGLGSKVLGISMFSGILFRIVVFTIMYLFLITYLRFHIKKIEKDATKSPTYEIDLEKKRHLNIHDEEPVNKRALKTYVIFFVVVLLATILATAFMAEITIVVIALTFLLGSIISGIVLKYGVKNTLNAFLSGLIAMSPAIIMLLFAGAVKFIIVDAQVMEVLIDRITHVLSGSNGFSAVILIYVMILFIQFFIGSASAKVILLMPIIKAVIENLMLSKEIALLAFVFGDGYTDLIYPTNPVLLIALGMSGMSYLKWFKKTWLLQIAILLLTFLFLYIAYQIGY